MLSRFKSLQDYAIRASDGEIGQVVNMLFDDQQWTVRYIIVNTGNWLFSRHVVISPVSVTELNGQDRAIQVKLTRHQVEFSPSVDTNLPMTREKEIELANHYEYMPYWGGAGSWGVDQIPNPSLGGAAAAERSLEQIERHEQQQAPDIVLPHLRSAREVIGYRIEARQRTLGHVSDFLIDAQTWALRYLIVDTGTLLPGKQLLIAPAWIDTIDWPASLMQVDLEHDQAMHAPAFDPDRPFERSYEEQLYAHYGRRPYWSHGHE